MWSGLGWGRAEAVVGEIKCKKETVILDRVRVGVGAKFWMRICARTTAKIGRRAHKENREQNPELQRQMHLRMLVHCFTFCACTCAYLCVSV